MKTAVEFLVETLAENGILHSSDIEQAKEMENQQIENAFEQGAKWQQERMYSEEDMIEFGKYLLQLSNSAMSRKFNMKMLDSETGIKLTKDLFEQFKKK